MKKSALTFTIVMALAMTGHAATVTWTDSDGDHDWGNTNNWSTLAVPTDADTASFPASIGGSATYEVHMNGDRHVDKVSINGSAYTQIIGPAYTLTVDVDIIGGKGADINTKVLFPSIGKVQCSSSYGNKIYLSGGMDCPAEVSFPGTVNNNVIVSNGVYTISNAIAYANTSFRNCVVTNSRLTVANNWADGDGNRTGLRIYSTADVTNTVFATAKNAGYLIFQNQDDAERSTHTMVRKIDHQQGNLVLANEFYGGTNLVTIQEFTCAPGALVRISNSKKGTQAYLPGVNAGFFIPGAANVNGTYKPNFIADLYLTKINEFGAIVVCDPSTDYTVAPVASYDPAKMYRQNAVADITLTQDIEVWAWLVNVSGDMAWNLGDFDMTVGSGNMVFNGSGVRGVNSTGGRLVFGGDDVIIYAAGSTGSLTFSAPLAWRKPAGSTVQYPSLIFSGTSLPEVVFAGEDEIEDYNAFNAEGGKNISYFVFAGSASRHFHGVLTGRNRIYNRGTGTLTFSGPDERRSAGTYLESGTTVLAHADAPKPTVVTNGAVCVIANGIAYGQTASIYNGGILCMEGTSASTVEPVIEYGARIEGGAPGSIGTFKTVGQIKPKSNLTIGLKISDSGSSLVSIGGTFYNPKITGGATMTVRVEDISNGTADIRSGNVYTVLSANAFSDATTYPLSFVVENGSPSSIDTSAATATYNASAKTITVTGIRSLRGTLIVVR